jgi:uncharacterized RDD family membrane protein YckC
MNQANLQGEYAGFLSRAAAFITDVLIISLVLIVLNWFVPAMMTQFMRIDLYVCADSAQNTLLLFTCKFTRYSLIVFSISFPPLYAIFFWIFAGQTPGKYLFGLRVVRFNGHRMNFVVGMIRYFGYALCLLSLGLGFLNVLINDRRQGWHDRLARTCVIYAWEARQNEAFLDRVRYRIDRLRAKKT